jgi:hypothetical protein
MPTHPLRDLAWDVDKLLVMPAVRERFISQINLHIDDLCDRAPRGRTRLWYVPAYELPSGQSQPPAESTTLGWLSTHDDENVLIHEAYAILAALRECVYKGSDRLELCAYGPLSVEMEEAFGCKPVQRRWELLIKTVNEELTEEHRSHVESWLRDVRVDFGRGLGRRGSAARLVKPDDLTEPPPHTDDTPAAQEEVRGHSERSRDGPEAGCRVRYGHRTVDLKGRIYTFVAFMWSRESAEFEALKEAVKEDAQDKTIHTWVNRANTAIAPLGLPWTLCADGVNRYVRKRLRQTISSNFTSESALPLA